MIIAVVGAEGTGKTSLSRALAGALGVSVLDPLKEAILAESGYHTLFEWDAATRGLEGLVDTQIAREAALTDAVVDGGVIELYALVQRWAWTRISPARFERLRDAVVRAASRYDRVILLPPRVVAGTAPGRFRSDENNLQLARLADAFVREAALPLLRLDDAPADARLAQARAAGSR